MNWNEERIKLEVSLFPWKKNLTGPLKTFSVNNLVWQMELVDSIVSHEKWFQQSSMNAQQAHGRNKATATNYFYVQQCYYTNMERETTNILRT